MADAEARLLDSSMEAPQGGSAGAQIQAPYAQQMVAGAEDRFATIVETVGFTVNAPPPGDGAARGVGNAENAQLNGAGPRPRDFSHVDLTLSKDYWDPLSDARWSQADNIDWSREAVLEMRRIAFILDKMYRLATTAPFLYMATYFLYYIIPSVVDDRVRSEYFPNVDSGQTAWTSLIGYLLGAIYFFVMIGVPRSRGYTAKAMAWNRPQIADPKVGTSNWDAPFSTRHWRPCPAYNEVDMMV